MNPQGILYLAIIAVLLVFSAFFSACDMAYSVVNKRKLKTAMDKGSSVAKRAYRYAEKYDETIVTVLFGNNLVNILASSLAAALSLLEPFSNNPMSSTYISLIMLAVLLVFGEILPKAFGKNFSYRIAMMSAPVLLVFEYAFFPISKSVSWIANLMTKPLLKFAPADAPASDEELQAMVDDIEDEGFIDHDQSELIQNSIEFKDTCAYEVMTPRVRIEGIEVTEDLNRYVLKEGAFRHSRIPVYRKNYDHIIGYIPVKGLQRAIINGQKLSFDRLMLPILEVPRTMEISLILELMKKSKHHIAVVKDEYGGTEGIVTLEDILEELVGELWDESEPIDLTVRKGERRNIYYAKGRMSIDEFFETFHLDEEEIDEDYETLSGWFNDKLGRFGKVGDSLEYGKLTISVLKASAYTVDEFKIVYHPRRIVKED